MVSDPEASDIEIEANQGFEVVWSRAQLVLQWLIGATVCAGLLGVFGDGWLSTTTRAFQSVPLSVTYQQLLRANAPADLTLATTARLAEDTLELGVGSELLDRGSIGSTQPGAINVSVQRGNQDETSASIKVRGTADLMTQGGWSPTGGIRSAAA